MNDMECHRWIRICAGSLTFPFFGGTPLRNFGAAKLRITLCHGEKTKDEIQRLSVFADFNWLDKPEITVFCLQKRDGLCHQPMT